MLSQIDDQSLNVFTSDGHQATGSSVIPVRAVIPGSSVITGSTVIPGSAVISRRQRQSLMRSRNMPTSSMVIEAINSQTNMRRGVSYTAIRKYIVQNYQAVHVNIASRLKCVKSYILGALKTGKLVRTTGYGVVGSFRLPVSKPKPIKRIVRRTLQRPKQQRKKRQQRSKTHQPPKQVVQPRPTQQQMKRQRKSRSLPLRADKKAKSPPRRLELRRGVPLMPEYRQPCPQQQFQLERQQSLDHFEMLVLTNQFPPNEEETEQSVVDATNAPQTNSDVEENVMT